MKLDTTVLVETPEGIDLRAEVAGVVPRALAYTIDFLLRAIVIFILLMTLAFTGKGGVGITLIVFFLLEWFYPVYFEVYKNGQTIGKKIFSIKVVHDDLTPIRFSASLTRNLLRAADFLPMFYMFGIITSLVSGKFQRLGDLAAGTLVVYKQEQSYISSDIDEIKAITPVGRMSPSLQGAFVDFCLGKGDISLSRQEELANIIRERIPEKYDDPVEYVRGVGKWYLGER
jgi:uncharacterized RDD family membrane protein YckC